jgi:Cd2+/Zn2+-exporting ATPase
MEHTDACCGSCASPAPDAHKQLKEAVIKEIRFGSYRLPLKQVMIFGAALVLWIAGLILMNIPKRLLAAVPLFAAYMLAGLPVLKNAIHTIRRGKTIDENFLMSIATIGALATGEWEEAVGVMVFYMIGELVQDAAVSRSRASINALLSLKPDMARIQAGGEWIEVAAESVEVASIVLVRAGERIPLDGLVLTGSGAVDASMLSGESRPVAVAAGSEVRSGTVSLDGVLTIKTTKTAGDSSAAKIIELVENAREAKAKPERFITSFARVYTPLVVVAAVLLAVLPPLFSSAPFTLWFHRALILLVISCPCALVVSVPLGYFAGIGGLSRRGIMIKGAARLDPLSKARYVIFDKTGTLTHGEFSVIQIEPAAGTNEDALLEAAALAEQQSNHPLARAIKAAAGRRCLAPDGKEEKGEEREIAGQGIVLRSGSGLILAGNKTLLETNGISVAVASASVYTPVYVAKNGAYLGRLLIGDALRDGAVEAIRSLKQLGIEKTLLFTGDTRASALAVAETLGIDEVEAELLPADKLSAAERLTHSGVTVFVGDGINDAPVLARADVGIAMGSGTDVAVEAADVILMASDPRRVSEAIQRARTIRRIITENVVFALSAKAIFIALAVCGLASMWIALIADVGVALAAILNASRALR